MATKPKALPALTEEDRKLADIARTYLNDSRVAFGKMFASNGLTVDGRIFAMVNRGRLVVKLPKERVDELVRAGAAVNFDAGKGRPMKEWAAMTGEKPSWEKLIREAFNFVGSG